MANTIQQKRSVTPGAAPTTAELTLGEFAIQAADGKIFVKTTADTIVNLLDYTFADGGEVIDPNPVVPPDAPTITSVYGSVTFGMTSATASATVNWTPPANTGGEIIGYTVKAYSIGGSDVTQSVGGNTTTFTFNNLTGLLDQCTCYTLSVRAVNSAGQSSYASATACMPDVNAPLISSVQKEPNPMGPGVQYTARWFGPCVGGPWNAYETQARLYYNGAEVVVTGTEDGWESFYSGSDNSHGGWISTATSTQQYQFRVRAKYINNGTLQSTSDWSFPATS